MNSRLQEKAKRMLDLTAAGVAMLLLGPLFGLVALAIWTRMGRPILFCHRRPGYAAKPFVLYKFRTMTDAFDTGGESSPRSRAPDPAG